MLHEIINSFKDNMMDKYSILADEYTSSFMKFDEKHNKLQESIASNTKKFETMILNYR